VNTLKISVVVWIAFGGAVGGSPQSGGGLRISWADKILRIEGDRVPGHAVEVWYLEAFCRTGSTNRDWRETTIPFSMEKTEADPNGKRIVLKSVTDGVVVGTHEIRAGHDEVDFRVELTNTGDRFVDVDWCQPCMRVGAFTGRKQDDYYEKCFLFTDDGLTRMHQTHRATEARYVPGQVYVPRDVNLRDVNPRPISDTRPINGLVGCFSADGSMILANAWDHTQELFQGVIVCIHNDPRIGGLAPGQTKRLHGKIYIVPNDVPRLLRRYRRDFQKGR